MTDNNFFVKQLMEWHRLENDRSLPWKSEKDPYRIWLSEIILQQTRALQALPYYLKFIEDFPTITALAQAKDEAVFKTWEGLGYYNRCRNMLHTARFIANERDGIFPDTYEQILALKGIGPYTAAAIASFAYNLPHAVVDGNVYRVLSRFFGLDTPYDTTKGKQEFAALADQLLPSGNSANYNQAIMDFGATVCTPKNARCANCVLQLRCFAYKKDLVNDLPVKIKSLTIKTRYFTYLVLKRNGKIWIKERKENDIWKNLFEFYLLETDHLPQPGELNNLIDQRFPKDPASIPDFSPVYRQQLTHRLIITRFIVINLIEDVNIYNLNGVWIYDSELVNYAFPKTIVKYLKEKVYF